MGPMLRWYVFTIALGLLPFGFSATLQTLRGVPPSQWQNSPELLFFSVMLCAAQLGGIFDTLSQGPPPGRLHRSLLGFAFGLFLLAAILSAGLYGVYIDHERGGPDVPGRGHFVYLCRAGARRALRRMAGFSDQSV